MASICIYGWVSVPVIGHPLGSDWGHYFTVAEYLWNPTPGLAYPDFRKPWFGWLLGGLGQWLGYLSAAQLIAKVSLMGIIAGSALLAAALSNRLAALVAAATVTLMPLAMDGALWVNHYPVLAAMMGLAIAFGAACVRWPSLLWVLASGGCAGIALALDIRGGVAVAVAGMLVVLGARGFRQMVLRTLCFGMVFGLVTAQDHWLQDTFKVPQLPFEQQLRVQRAGTLEQISQGLVGGETLAATCRGETVQRLGVSAAWSTCGKALRAASHQRLAAAALIPSVPVLAIVGLCFFPAAGWARRRSAFASAVVFGGPLLSVLIGMAWVTYFDRYILPFAALLAAFVPIACARSFGLGAVFFPSFSRAAKVAGAISAIGVSLVFWPGLSARALDAPEAVRSSEYHAGVFADWVSNSLQDGDGVVDCAGLAVDSLLLPRRVDYVRFPPGDADCVALVKHPVKRAGINYLITMHRDLPMAAKMTDLPFDHQAVSALGWVPVPDGPSIEGYRLWRHQ